MAQLQASHARSGASREHAQSNPVRRRPWRGSVCSCSERGLHAIVPSGARVRLRSAGTWGCLPILSTAGLPVAEQGRCAGAVTGVGVIQQRLVTPPDAVIVAEGPALAPARTSLGATASPCIERTVRK